MNSGVYKNIQREVSVATAIATVVVVANTLLGGFTDIEGVQHAGLLADLHLKLALPMTPFTLASPSLGLLLGKYAQSVSRSFFCLERPHLTAPSLCFNTVFRTNTSYQRWDEARKNWG